MWNDETEVKQEFVEVVESIEKKWACIEIDNFSDQNVRKRILSFSNVDR